jgi:hypothetical protein
MDRPQRLRRPSSLSARLGKGRLRPFDGLQRWACDSISRAMRRIFDIDDRARLPGRFWAATKSVRGRL